jgi:excisionase family DNA binding protein
MDYISTKKAAELIGVSQRRILAMIAAGQLPNSQRVGTIHLVKRADLDAVKDRKPGRPSTKPEAKPAKRKPKKGKGA